MTDPFWYPSKNMAIEDAVKFSSMHRNENSPLFVINGGVNGYCISDHLEGEQEPDAVAINGKLYRPN